MRIADWDWEIGDMLFASGCCSKAAGLTLRRQPA
jgi:hypothetical protein